MSQPTTFNQPTTPPKEDQNNNFFNSPGFKFCLLIVAFFALLSQIEMPDWVKKFTGKYKIENKKENAKTTSGDYDLLNFEKLLEELNEKSTKELLEILFREDDDSLLANVIRTILLRRGIAGESIPFKFLRDGCLYHFFFLQIGAEWVIIVVKDNGGEGWDDITLLIDDILTDDRYVASVSAKINQGKYKIEKDVTHLNAKQPGRQDPKGIEPDGKVFEEHIEYILKKLGLVKK